MRLCPAASHCRILFASAMRFPESNLVLAAVLPSLSAAPSCHVLMTSLLAKPGRCLLILPSCLHHVLQMLSQAVIAGTEHIVFHPDFITNTFRHTGLVDSCRVRPRVYTHGVLGWLRRSGLCHVDR